MITLGYGIGSLSAGELLNPNTAECALQYTSEEGEAQVLGLAAVSKPQKTVG